MTQPEYTGADRACDCDPPNICEILAELQAMKDRIENMIVSVQGLPGDHAGNVQLPFAEDIGDSTLGVSGTFAGGHAVLQVKGIADNADETARNAQDIAQIAADAANAADGKAGSAAILADQALQDAGDAKSDAGLALAAAHEAQAAVGNSVMGIGPSVAEETQVRVPYRLKDGTQGAFLVPAVDPDSAGVLTPAQFTEVSQELDSHGEQINAHEVQLNNTVDMTSVQTISGEKEYTPRAYFEGGTTKNTLMNYSQIVTVVIRTIAPRSLADATNINVPPYTRFVAVEGLYEAKFKSAEQKTQFIELSDRALARSNMTKWTNNSPHLNVGYQGLMACTALSRADLQNCERLNNSAFNGCSSLDTFILRNHDSDDLCVMNAPSVFENTPIAQGTGYIYVRDDLVSAYKKATNWSIYSKQIKGLSELPA